MANRWDVISMRPGKEEKPFYHRIGTMFEGKKPNSFSVKLDSLPLTNDKGEIWLSIYLHEPKPEPQQRNATTGIDDEMPF